MFAMQYGFDLPASLAMRSLRERIALRGQAFEILDLSAPGLPSGLRSR